MQGSIIGHGRKYAPLQNKNFNKIKQAMISGLSITISAQILLIPIMANNFNTLSLVFLISNIIAMPLFAIIVSVRVRKYFYIFYIYQYCQINCCYSEFIFKSVNVGSRFHLKIPICQYNYKNSTYNIDNYLLHYYFGDCRDP